MQFEDWVHLLDGVAGAAALFMGYQIKQATKAIRHVVSNHEQRIEKLEAKRGYRRKNR